MTTRDASSKEHADLGYRPQPTAGELSEHAVHSRKWSPRAELWLNVARTCNVSFGNLGMEPMLQCIRNTIYDARSLEGRIEGLVVALTGVALLDLGEIYDTSISAVSQLITARCIGGLVGSLLGGKLYDAYNTQVVSILSMALACFTALMIPLSGTLTLAYFMIFLLGLSLGAFGTGANVWILKMWPENSSPALQGFHLAFGIGCLSAPFIARPFLSAHDTNSNTNATVHIVNTKRNGTDDLDIYRPEYKNVTHYDGGPSDSTIYCAFGIASAFQFVLVASMAALYFIDNTSFSTRRTNAVSGVGGIMKESAEYIRFARITQAMLCAYMCVYVALECTTSQMMTAFAVKCDLHFSKPLASRLVAVYFLCFAGSRLVAALITFKVSAFSVLIAAHVLLVTTAAVQLAWGSSSPAALWAASALAGIAQGPLNAAVVAWVAKDINISNKMMSIVVVTGGLGSLSPPLLVGQFLDSAPNVFVYVCFIAVTLSVFVFSTMCLYLRRKPLLYEKSIQLIENVSPGNPHQKPLVQDVGQ